MIEPASLLLFALTIVLGTLVLLKRRERLGDALRLAGRQGGRMLIPLCLAVFVGSALARLVPTESIGALIGAESGWRGIAVASLIGAFVPGGPMAAFPIALLVWRMGAGQAQLVTFLAAWSIFAVHRFVSYELPLLGGRFVVVRLCSSWFLPPVAGVLASIWLALT